MGVKTYQNQPSFGHLLHQVLVTEGEAAMVVKEEKRS